MHFFKNCMLFMQIFNTLWPPLHIPWPSEKFLELPPLNTCVTFTLLPSCIVPGPGDGACPQPLDCWPLIHQHNNGNPRRWHRFGSPLTQEDRARETTLALQTHQVRLVMCLFNYSALHKDSTNISTFCHDASSNLNIFVSSPGKPRNKSPESHFELFTVSASVVCKIPSDV